MQKRVLPDVELVDQLSRAIDELNAGKAPKKVSGENIGLVGMAQMMKAVARDPEIPPIPGSLFSKEAMNAGRASGQKKLTKSLRGIAAAAVLMIAFGSYQHQAGQPPLVAYSPPIIADEPVQGNGAVETSSERASQPMNSAAPAEPHILSSPQKSAASVDAEKPAPIIAAKAMNERPKAAVDAAPNQQTNTKTPLMVVLAGLRPDQVTVNLADGTRRSVYNAGKKDEIVITQADHLEGMTKSFAAARVASQPETGGNDKVTIVRDGKEITLEGKMSKAELLKKAEMLITVEEPE